MAVWGGLTVAGLVLLIRVMLGAEGRDMHAYWAFSPVNPYQVPAGSFDSFLYSPVAALAFLPLHALPFEVARVLWLAVGVACLVYLLGRWSIAAILLPPVFTELAFGNIHLVLAAALVAGLRHPGAWAFLLLTKVTPGVAIVWFAARREWRSLTLAIVTTAGLAAVSMVVVPTWWGYWVSQLFESSRVVLPLGFAPGEVLTTAPLALRLFASAMLTVWAGLSGRSWVLPFAVALSLPIIWVTALVVLLACWRLLRETVHANGARGDVSR